MEEIDDNQTLIIDPDHSCRLCLSQSLDMQNIRSNWLVGAYIVSIVDMLAYALDITVDMKNTLPPRNICTDCLKQLIAFYQFKQKVKSTDELLISAFPSINVVQCVANDGAPLPFARANSSDEHSQCELIEEHILDEEIEIETTNKTKEIENCDLQSKDHESIVTVEHIEDDDVLLVEDNEGDQSTRSLRRCVETKSSTIKLKKRKKSPPQMSLRDYFANVDVNSDIDGIEKELSGQSHHTMRLIIKNFDFIPCHNCCLLFASKDKLREHSQTFHPELEPIDKPHADFTFLDDFKVQKVYSCGECNGLSFTSISQLKSHVLGHASNFNCPMVNCGCQYKRLIHLCIHVAKKHINMTHQVCFHCNQAFKSYDELQKHIKDSCPAKTIECFECDKKFYSKKALNEHLKTTEGDRFKCNKCGKLFKKKASLIIHTRCHTNERPFKCTICDKTYKTSSMRAAHMDTHISEKTFECKLCGKKLQTRVTYRVHMKRHTEQKRFKCFCGKQFFSNHHMKLHQSNVHKEEVTKALLTPRKEDDNLNKILNDGDYAKFIDDDDFMKFLL